MNSACIIAACAANARNNSSAKPQNSCGHTEVYYKVEFRMYLHFNQITIVTPVEKVYLGSIYAPYQQLLVKPVKVPGQTIATVRTFYLAASKCKKGPDKYLEDRLEDFKKSPTWLSEKTALENEYLDYIKRTYNIELTRDSLDYYEQFCWEIS